MKSNFGRRNAFSKPLIRFRAVGSYRVLWVVAFPELDEAGRFLAKLCWCLALGSGQGVQTLCTSSCSFVVDQGVHRVPVSFHAAWTGLVMFHCIWNCFHCIV